jgi:hypothetical protein
VGNINFAAAVLASLKEISPWRRRQSSIFAGRIRGGHAIRQQLFFHGADYGGSGLEFQTFRESSADFCRDTGPIGIWCCACRDWPFSSAFKPIDLGLGFKVH